MLPTINNECSLFLIESKGKPLTKLLPKNADGYRKVKVRKKKPKNEFEQTFNESFFTEYNEIRSRAVFVNGVQSHSPEMDLFYIFPVDGYRFMYSPQVKNSNELYKDTFDKLIQTAGKNNGMEIFTDMLQLSYQYEDLPHAISLGCEIILYDIPYYYAVRTSLVDDYKFWFYNT